MLKDGASDLRTLPPSRPLGSSLRVSNAWELYALVASPVSPNPLRGRHHNHGSGRTIESGHSGVVSQFVDGMERRWLVAEQGTHTAPRIFGVFGIKVGEKREKAAPQIGMQRFTSAERKDKLNRSHNAGCCSDPSPIYPCPGRQQVRERNDGAQAAHEDKEIQGSIDPGKVPLTILVIANVLEKTETASLLVGQRRRGLFGSSQSVGLLSCWLRFRSSSIRCRRSCSSSSLRRRSSSRILRSASSLSRSDISRNGLGIIRPLVHGAGLSIRSLQSVQSVGCCEAWVGSRPSQATLLTTQNLLTRQRKSRVVLNAIRNPARTGGRHA